jgi:GAF domain-containing protein
MASSSVIDADPEQARLAALHSYRIIDTPPESQFDAIVKRAADICKATAATLVLVDEHRCWFKARIGVVQTEIARELSFCNYALRSSGAFVVPDAKKDPRFNHLPVVNDDGFQFFAAMPLVTPHGFSIGTLCVLDRHPRELTPAQTAALKMLSTEAMDLLSNTARRTSPHRCRHPRSR